MRPVYIYGMSLNSSQNEKCVIQNFVENQNTFYVVLNVSINDVFHETI